MAALQELHALKCGDIATKDVKTLKKDDTVEAAMRLFADEKVSSAPIVDDAGKPVAIIDILDCAMHVESIASATEGDNTEASLESAGRAMALKTAVSVANAHEALTPLDANDPSSLAAQMFANGGIHRCPLTDGDNHLVGIVSQSDIVKTIAPLLSSTLEPFGKCTLEELYLGCNDVVACRDNMSVMDVLSTLCEAQVTAVALVDSESGKLTGVFSAGCLTAMFHEKMPAFLKTAKAYLEENAAHALKPLTLHATATFKDVADLLSNQSEHRVWIVDEEGKPTSVVTATDVCAAILACPQPVKEGGAHHTASATKKKDTYTVSTSSGLYMSCHGGKLSLTKDQPKDEDGMWTITRASNGKFHTVASPSGHFLSVEHNALRMVKEGNKSHSHWSLVQSETKPNVVALKHGNAFLKEEKEHLKLVNGSHPSKQSWFNLK